MIARRIVDWDDAYANGRHIADGDRWPAAWVQPAQDYRDALERAGRAMLDIAYGQSPRNRFDLFLPETAPAGLVVFVHGGYWLALDKSYWSHLAQGAIDRGFAVAMPSYSLCPERRIAHITGEIGAAIEKAAAQIDGPIFLTGHSAGGHLVTRMICETSPLPDPIRARIRHVLSISGLHDLRPIMRTAMNAQLGLDEMEADTESPALLHPIADARVTCWVGGAERAEFVRQSQLLANIWTGLGARIQFVGEPDRHHFNVVDGLGDADHPLVRSLLCE